jgi:hypothetical protein
MNNFFHISKDTINAINELREEARTISDACDLNVTYIINIFIIGNDENPIEIRCGRHWPLSVVMKTLNGVLNMPTGSMKFIACVNHNWIHLNESKTLKEYENILEQTKYTIFLTLYD